VTSLALAPVPTTSELVLNQLEDLRLRLVDRDVDFSAVIGIRDQAETVRAYAASARLGRDVANRAIELRLRAERRCGVILREMTVAAGPTTTRPRPGQTTRERESLPPHTLRNLGIGPSDSSRMQLLSKLDDREFEARIDAAKSAGRQLSTEAFVRAAAQFRRKPGGRKAAPTTERLLNKALELLRSVRTLSTAREVALARQVVQLGEAWSLAVSPPPAPAPTAITRETSCLLCGRPQPASKPSRCPHCHGAWLEL
jgi:hypothetical protein